jgi:hypothetical protein
MSPQPLYEESNIASLRDAYTSLRHTAVLEAMRPVNARTRNAPWLYRPSRMKNTPTRQAETNAIFLAAWPEAIAKRLAQLRRLNAKLVRIDPDWRNQTDAQICDPPQLAWIEGNLTQVFAYPIL